MSGVCNFYVDAGKALMTALDAFERETLEALGMPSELPMRHRSPHFGHIFSGEGYSAGYYSYLWSLVYAQDMFGRFEELGILEQLLEAHPEVHTERPALAKQLETIREAEARGRAVPNHDAPCARILTRRCPAL